MQGDYHLKWYNYIPVILFYLVSLFLTIGFICSFGMDENINKIIRIIVLIIYILILLFTLYYHYKSMTISNIINNDYFLIDLKQNEKNYCHKCNKERPNRAHHCKVCGVCILKMDHHCPWIANCVGEKNEREFIYFLIGSTSGIILIVLFTFKYFIIFIKNGGQINNTYDFHLSYFTQLMKDISSSFKYGTCVVSFAVGLCLFIVSGNYLMNNIKYDITTIEMIIFRNYKDCPYYNDNLKENFIKKIKPLPLPLLNNYLNESNDLNDDLKYKNFDEENVNLLNKEKEV